MTYIWQISTSSAVVAFDTVPVPQYISGSWLVPYDRYLLAVVDNSSWYVPMSSVYALGPGLFLGFELWRPDYPISRIALWPHGIRRITDLGGYRILTCGDSAYSVQLWHNASYKEHVELPTGCHVHTNTMMAKHDQTNQTVLTSVAMVTNHTFGLHYFVKPVTSSHEIFSKWQESAQHLDTLFTQNQHVIDKLHQDSTAVLKTMKQYPSLRPPYDFSFDL